MLDDFKQLVITEDPSAEMVLKKLKAKLLDMDSLPPLSMDTVNAVLERALAMEVFEYAVIMAVNNSDRDSFQRYMSCLKPYYTHYSR